MCGEQPGLAQALLQMEVAILIPYMLGLLLLPLLAVLLMALCVRCRELPSSYDSAASDSLAPSSILIKQPREYMEGFLPQCKGEGPLAGGRACPFVHFNPWGCPHGLGLSWGWGGSCVPSGLRA